MNGARVLSSHVRTIAGAFTSRSRRHNVLRAIDDPDGEAPVALENRIQEVGGGERAHPLPADRLGQGPA